MRITEITHDGSTWSPLVLHPRLNVIVGDAASLADVEAVIGDLYAVAGGAVGGGIEYSGFEMPLDQTAVVSLDLHGRGMRTLDAAVVEEACSAMRSELVAGVDSRLHEVDGRIADLDAELGILRRKAAAAEAALAAVSEEISHSTGVIEELTARHEQAVERPRELRAEIEAAASAVDAASSALAEAEAIADEVCERLDPNGPEVRSLRLGGETTQLVELTERAAARSLSEGGLLESVTGWLEDVAAGTAETSREIVGMLDEIEELDAEWNELAARGVEGDQEVVEAREHHREVSLRAENLEQLASSGLLARRAREEIDAAHESGDDGEEARVLSLYGFESYLSYTIAISTRSVGEAMEATMDRVRAELVRASDTLEAAREEGASARLELNRRREALRERVTIATGADAESLTAEALAAIPEIPSTLGDVVREAAHSLEGLRGDLVRAETELARSRRELEDAPDPAAIEAELASERERMAAFEPLWPRAAEVRDEAVEVLETTEATLETLRHTHAELMEERAGYETPSATSSSSDVAVMARAAVDGILVPDAEPTPVLLVDSFVSAGTAAPDVLEAVSADVGETQLVYLTGDDAVAGWAKRLPGHSGRLHRIGPRRWLGRRIARPRRRKTGVDGR